jgi:hypothetical protein
VDQTGTRFLRENRDELVDIVTKKRAKALALLATALNQTIEVLLEPPSEHDPISFGSRLISAVRSCDDLDYNDHRSTIAYAYLHMLERYRRTWDVLTDLLKVGALPAPRYGVNYIDVGTGPAPTLFATQDFYATICNIARSRGVRSEPYEVFPTVVEPGRGMVLLMHHLSERRMAHSSGVPGPFGAKYTDFQALDLRDDAAAARKSVVDPEWESYYEAGEWHEDLIYKEPLDSTTMGHIDRQFTFRLAVFSNVITTVGQLRAWQPAITRLVDHLSTGAVIVFLGGGGGDSGSNKSYGDIYEQLEELLVSRSWKPVQGIRDRMTSRHDDDEAAIIRKFQRSMWPHLEAMFGDQLEVAKTELRIDHIWKESYVPSGASRYSFRAYYKVRSSVPSPAARV